MPDLREGAAGPAISLHPGSTSRCWTGLPSHRKRPEYMHWQLAQCLCCDLLYADPAPRPDDLAALYRQADFDSRREAHSAAATYGRLLPRIVPHLPDCRGAVDVGTGDGAFLAELIAHGFNDVGGIEPSTAPIEAADPAVRPLIRHDVFHSGSFEPESLSLITCFQTIEHLADPLSFCRCAWTALKPGGALFLVGHNRRAFSAKVLGRKSPIFDIEHLQLFSLESVAGCSVRRASAGSRRSRYSTVIPSLTGRSSSHFPVRSRAACSARWSFSASADSWFRFPPATWRRSATSSSGLIQLYRRTRD